MLLSGGGSVSYGVGGDGGTDSGSSSASHPLKLVLQYKQVAVSSSGVLEGVYTKPAFAIFT